MLSTILPTDPHRDGRAPRRRPRAAPHVAAGLALMLTCGCSQGPRYPYANEPDPTTTPYVIGVADEVAIDVYQHGEFATKQAVRPDGVITLPLVGEIQAAGLSSAELQRDVRKALAAYVKGDPAVTVAVTGANSYFVTVAGRVATPGRFDASDYLRVADAIALTGGPTPFASPSEVHVLRRTDTGETKRIPIDYSEVAQGDNLEQNIYLLPGDQVLVP